ncbi:MAG: polysaccharide deacetylase family protein [Bacteroidota bacterium]
MISETRLTIVILALITVIHYGNAQTNAATASKNGLVSSQEKVEMLFPGGKTKALILSFDDGMVADRRLVRLMNEYGLIGTFHLNSNKLGTKDYLTKEEIKVVYKGHEISAHTVNHPNLPDISRAEVLYEVGEDRRELERLSGNLVRGMAYPFGNYNDSVIEIINSLGIEYARTVKDTYMFGIPNEFLKWHPTIHQFGKAYFTPDNPENDKKELAGFYQVVNHFLKTDSLALLDVWGHSWENEGAGNRWTEMEKFFKMVSMNPDIYYTTQIGLVDYINAFKNLKFTLDKSMVTNLSSINVFIKMKGKAFNIEAGSTRLLD